MSKWSRRLVLAVLAASLLSSGCGPSGSSSLWYPFDPSGMSYSVDPRLQVRTSEATDPMGSEEASADESDDIPVPIREGVLEILSDIYGPTPNRIVVPPRSGLTSGRTPDGRVLEGILLANFTANSLDSASQDDFNHVDVDWGTLVPDSASAQGRIEGGYALYRRHCLHCHGVSGDGNGPTAPFLFPKPRDFRPGLYKFVSTGNGNKPSRDDLRRTLKHGLHGSSMPSFDALMEPHEIEQVIDYMIFLSMRGETERRFIEEAAFADPEDPVNSLNESRDMILYGDDLEGQDDGVPGVFDAWILANQQTVEPLVPRTPRSPSSIRRGRQHFLALGCVGCHGVKADGNGETFIAQPIFEDAYFRKGYPLIEDDQQRERVVLESIVDYLRTQDFLDHHVHHGEHGEAGHDENETAVETEVAAIEETDSAEPAGSLELNDEQQALASRLGLTSDQAQLLVQFNLNEVEAEIVAQHGLDAEQVAELAKFKKQWYDSLDEWGNPRRSNNLNKGVYRGGRRPVDLFWRIHNGINGVGMPSYVNSLMPREGTEEEKLRAAHAEIWDIVNFVLELPNDPTLLHNPPTPESTTAPSMARAN